MNRRPLHLSSLLAVVVLAASPFTAPAAESASGLEPLQGTWSVTRTNRQGQQYLQSIEIQKDQFTFRVRSLEQELRFHATATIKPQKLGPFNTFTLSNLRIARATDPLEPVEGERTFIYLLRADALSVVSNFDRERQDERPSLDTYFRAAPTTPATTEPFKPLLGTWNVDVHFGDNKVDYELRLDSSGAKLTGALISPRTGEHRARLATYQDGELRLEIDRNFEGSPVTFLYRGKLVQDALTGSVTVKGREDQFSGHWKAVKAIARNGLQP